jgi:hypothetical protein
MSLIDIVVGAGFCLLGIAALPLTWLRRALLWLLHWTGHAAVFAGVAICALFGFQPNLVPNGLNNLLGSLTPAGSPLLGWLTRAALLVGCSLPLLAQLQNARDLAHNCRFMKALRKRLAPLTNADASANGSGNAAGRTYTPEMEAALDAIRAAPGTARTTALSRPRKLVNDLVNSTHS